MKKGNSKIYITCPNCGIRITSKNKGFCPSCRKTIPHIEADDEQLSNNTKVSNTFLVILLVISALIFIGSISIYQQQRKKQIILSCEVNDQVFVEDTASCRDKTISERFDEKCVGDTIINDKRFSCSELKQANLERAYLNDDLIMHDNQLYEKGTSAEITAGKNAGDYCLSASDTWNHYGEKRCVVFQYTYLSCSNGYCFLNEKQDYNNGFVAFFGKYKMYTWENFRATYYGNGPILVCGTIVSYNGHPEIKITNLNQTILQPKGTVVGYKTVYRYTCS